MSLKDELARLRAASAQKFPAETLAVMQGATKDLIASGIAEQSAGEGSAAPDFSLPNANGEPVASEALWGDGPAVVSFYRGGWCPYCNVELKALQDRLPEIEALGARLVAITPETPDNALTTQEKNEIGFDVLSDDGNRVASAFGLTFRLPDAVNDLYKGFGIDLESSNGEASQTLPVPATFVIGKGGTVLKAFVDADYTTRAEPDEIIAALKEADE
ncbi:MAG: peroxiredoxin-like family protein [Rhodospirillales bacterium]|nr:peroxiredoxin-like family protein [Rhodospirillales bacterium]MDE0381843.1 peroxiredoxin-like family protein [Rhodospirillales bacterium]MDE0388054.1 peroxiredoxin-like family protein [Rhodospirillales bacterium]